MFLENKEGIFGLFCRYMLSSVLSFVFIDVSVVRGFEEFVVGLVESDIYELVCIASVWYLVESL